MRDWFESLELRERAFVAVGAAIVFVAIIYAFAWSPVSDRYARLQSDVENLERAVAELRPLRMTASGGQATRAPVVRGGQQSPIIIVDQSLRSRDLDRYRRRSQPTTSNGIRVEFENVAFDELVIWLGDLGEQYGMHVQAGSFAAGSQSGPGRINATLTLERAL